MMIKRFDVPQLDRLIEKYGWIIVGVPGVITYTVGMIDLFAHPELAIHGLEVWYAERAIRAAVELVRDKKMLVPGRRYDGVFSKVPALIGRVHESNYADWFGQALVYHGGDLRMVQVMWPDESGRYPGDPGCSFNKFPVEQGRFDVRRPEYYSTPMCGCCGEVM